MKRILTAMALSLSLMAGGQSLVLLHTNDTHSNIDSDAAGIGGILPRMAIIDSVRKAEKNVLLIDAGDMVQGTLYFKFFKGDVEYPLFNMMNYDVRILGNHEFDNGLDELARHYKNVKGARLSANYDFSDTPAKGLFDPYVIKKIDGRKVGIMGINVNPESLISEENYKGMKFKDIIETANQTAAELKRKGCDLVIAVTHIGYDMGKDKTDDIDLARASKDIDIIIGGHSHTFVDPSKSDIVPHWFKNAAGKDVLVAQTGKYGKNIGYIKLDLKDFGNRKIDYEYIPVTDRFEASRYNKKMIEFLLPYRQAVDSVNSHVIGWSLSEMNSSAATGAYPNWAGDFGARFGRHVADSLRKSGVDVPRVDLGIMNVGGIRHDMKKGPVTEGQILSTFPFSNRMRLIEISGKNLIETMKIVAPKGGEAVSSEVTVVTDTVGNFERMYIDGVPVDPEKNYVVSTIDYVAEGNDDMTPMKNHREIWRDDQEVSVRILEYLYDLQAAGIPVSADPNPRFVKNINYTVAP